MASLRGQRRRFKLKSCNDKKKYSTLDEACIALGNNHQMVCYLCKFCQNYHLGHKKFYVENKSEKRFISKEIYGY